ncbi:MAG: AbrB/MazE/SpoVT family DNA-binding domain-containing protein [Propionibacteriaceae bacterium]|jgi:AbrB family looped-hinge helix DNA binding protein|nr:AbrB/MazE/SpoVT family DNA-binding domain-containing protein [Propionibacteriaceae bacterium]
MTSKGQVTVPVNVRRALGLARGDRVEFLPAEGGFLMRPSRKTAARLAGFFGPYSGQPVSVEQMNEDIAQAAAQ